MSISLKDEPKDSPTYRGIRLSILRYLCGCKTIKDFCAFPDSNLNVRTFVEWENGRHNGISKVGAKKVIARAEDLGVFCSFVWLMYGVGFCPSFDHSLQLSAEQEKQALTIFQEILPATGKRFTAELTVSDHSMAPDYLPGDLVAGSKITDNWDLAVGRVCLVQLSEGAILLRRIESRCASKFVLKANNPDFSCDFTGVAVALRMVAPINFWRRLPEF